MKKIFFSLIILILGFQESYSQVPGYRGRRLIINGDIYFFSAINNPNKNYENGFFKINYRPEASIEYITGRSGCIGFNASFIGTGYFKNENYYQSSWPYSHVNQDAYYQIKGNAFGIYYKYVKHKKNGSIYPYGLYQKIGLSILNYKAEFDKGDKDFLKTSEKSGNCAILSLGIGKQQIVKDRILIRFGAEFGLLLPPDFGGEIKSRLQGYYLFNLHGGLGFLIGK